MRLVKRAAVTVTPKPPYITWANALDEDGAKLDEDFESEKNVYLIGESATSSRLIGTSLSAPTSRRSLKKN
jgi:hypothetical protein